MLGLLGLSKSRRFFCNIFLFTDEVEALLQLFLVYGVVMPISYSYSLLVLM